MENEDLLLCLKEAASHYLSEPDKARHSCFHVEVWISFSG